MNALASWDANGAPLDIELLENGSIVENELTHEQQIAYLGHQLGKFPQTECPLKHHFAPGVYVREIAMPAETIIIGHIHKTEHLNILIQGACYIVHEDNTREELRAPMTFVSKAGVQKVLYITENMIWQTVHVTDETDIERLEAMLTEPVPPDPMEQLT
jgi:hypothetical protein